MRHPVKGNLSQVTPPYLICNTDASFKQILNVFVFSNTHHQLFKKAILYTQKTAIIEAFGIPRTRKFVIKYFAHTSTVPWKHMFPLKFTFSLLK